MRNPAMARILRGSRAKLFALTALTATAAAGGVIAFGATPASADTTITVTYPVTGSTFIKKINTTEDLGSGSLSSTLDLNTSAVSGTLSLPSATASFKEFGFIPVSATTELVQTGAASGTANLTTNTVSVTSTSTLEITGLKVAGIKIPVGSNCHSGAITTTLNSQAGFSLLGGGTLSGTYTIPKFSGCGLIADALINLTLPGSGNTITLTLGAATL
ncbi:MAG TPA: hypothetical protein VGI58_21990 [Streptosporangiaceae bacterium]